MLPLGRLLVFAGILLVIVGALLLFAGRTGIPLGRLPGDFSHEGKNFKVYFPLGTSLLLSVLVSVILWIISRWRR